MLSLIKRLEEIPFAELRNLILELKNIGASDSPTKEEKSNVLSDLFSLFDEHVYFSWVDKYDIILREMNNEALRRFYNGILYSNVDVLKLFSELQSEMAQQIIGNRGDEKIIPTEWIKTKINL